jgi:hypothetical protein
MPTYTLPNLLYDFGALKPHISGKKDRRRRSLRAGIPFPQSRAGLFVTGPSTAGSLSGNPNGRLQRCSIRNSLKAASFIASCRSWPESSPSSRTASAEVSSPRIRGNRSSDLHQPRRSAFCDTHT